MSSSTNSSPFVPGFSDEQITSLINLFRGLLRSEIGQLRSEMDQLRDEIRQSNPNQIVKQATQEATLPHSQVIQSSIQKKKRNEKTRRQYKRRILQQALMKKSTPSSSDTIQISLLSTLPSQTIKQVMRESAYNAPLFTCQYTLLLAYQHGSSLLAFQPTFCLLALSPGYIEHTEDMEATGQG